MPGPGVRLCQDFYRQAVAPLLGSVEHGAALLGEGSEVLGFDDEVSTDHDFGPRVQIFRPRGADPGPVRAALDGLPAEFQGYPLHAAGAGGPVDCVQVTTAEDFFADRLGVDPAGGMGLADWLLTPAQTFASLTAGAVLHDPGDRLAARRAALAWYPDDVWRYALAAGWLRISQEHAFVGRAGSRGDDLGAAILTARLARDLVRLAFLAERRWAPYGKWFDHAFRQLPLAETLRPHLLRALAAPAWREKEAALCDAATVVGEATNRLALAAPVDPQPRRFYDRDIRIVDAETFTTSLTSAITDPEVRALLGRLGVRSNTGAGMLPGTIDQAADSTDLLSHLDRRRAMAPALGLPTQ